MSTAILVVEQKSLLGEQAINKAITNGLILPEEAEKWSKKWSEKWSSLTSSRGEKSLESVVSLFPSQIVEEVYKALNLNLNRKAKYSWLMDYLGVSEATIKRAIADLKELRLINPEKTQNQWGMASDAFA